MHEPDGMNFESDRTAIPEGEAGRDKRAEYRLSGRANVVLELEAADPDGAGHGQRRTLTAQTHDLSVTGIRVITSEPLIRGAILPIQVRLSGDEQKYQLIAEVVWCEQRESRQYAVGLSVMDSDGTSFMDWMDAVARAMVQD